MIEIETAVGSVVMIAIERESTILVAIVSIAVTGGADQGRGHDRGRQHEARAGRTTAEGNEEAIRGTGIIGTTTIAIIGNIVRKAKGEGGGGRTMTESSEQGARKVEGAEQTTLPLPPSPPTPFG